MKTWLHDGIDTNDDHYPTPKPEHTFATIWPEVKAAAAEDADTAARMAEAYNFAVDAYQRVEDLVDGPARFRDLPFMVRQRWVKAVWELKEACREATT